MLEQPIFEKAESDQAFNQGDDAYYIDKNKYDIFLVQILKKHENNFIVEFKDHDAKPKKVTIDRILPITPTNDSIYAKQVKIREKDIATKKEKKEKEKILENEQNEEENEEEDNLNDKNTKKEGGKSKSKKVVKKKGVKAKKTKKWKGPIIDYNTIIVNAWQNGIQNPERFNKYVKKDAKRLCEAYKQYYDTMKRKTNDHQPLFILGGYDANDKSDAKEIKKFWLQANSLWTKLFEDSISVKIGEFNKKLIELMKLPHQTESNAREAIEYFFSPDENGKDKEISYTMFCAFLALFSPYKTALRKIRDFFNIPSEYKDIIQYYDPIDIVEEDLESEINCFEINHETNNPIIVYNLPHVPYGKEYLIDENGIRYKSWDEFFGKKQILSSSNPIDLPHEENDGDGDNDDDDSTSTSDDHDGANNDHDNENNSIDSIIEEELNQNEDGNEDSIPIMEQKDEN